MKNKIRIAYLAFFLVFLLSIFSVKVFADEDIIEEDETSPAVVTQAPAPATAAPKPATQAAPTKKVTKPTKSAQVATKRQTYSNSDNNVNNNSNSNNNSSVNNNNNNNNYTVAPRATQKAIVSSTKATTSPIYDTDKSKVNTDTLKKGDWESIANQLEKSDSDTTDTDVESFDYIKNNTSEGDNGIWMLYLGIGLEIVAALIIITLIILAVRRHKKAAVPQRAASSTRAQAPRRSGGDMPPRESARREPSRQQRSGGSRAQDRNVKRRSKFDTDEVNIKNNSHRSVRYKPRH